MTAMNEQPTHRPWWRRRPLPLLAGILVLVMTANFVWSIGSTSYDLATMGPCRDTVGPALTNWRISVRQINYTTDRNLALDHQSLAEDLTIAVMSVYCPLSIAGARDAVVTEAATLIQLLEPIVNGQGLTDDYEGAIQESYSRLVDVVDRLDALL